VAGYVNVMSWFCDRLYSCIEVILWQAM